ncbi:MAG: hypothetical protein IJ297_06660 [Clostridia bacterium]|nr:hypothetical protein [Clostridia bacterium]
MSIEERRNKCIEFVLVTLGVFWSGFAMYGLIGGFEGSGTLMGIIGGYMFAAMYCGGYYAINLIKNRSLPFKVAAGFFGYIIIIVAMLFGLFSLIPMIIINIAKYVSLDREIKKTEAEETIDEVQPKKKSKSVLISVCIILVCAALAISVVTIVGHYTGKLSTLEKYSVDEYTVPSMTKIVGERKATGVSKNVTLTGSSVTYTYRVYEDVIADVEAYANHLLENEDFRLGTNEAGKISVYKYVGENDRLDIDVLYVATGYTVEVRFTDR